MLDTLNCAFAVSKLVTLLQLHLVAHGSHRLSNFWHLPQAGNFSSNFWHPPTIEDPRSTICWTILAPS